MSTNIAHWLQDLALLPDFDSGHWQPFLHSTSSQRLDRHSLSQALAGLGPVSGWLQETGRTLTLRKEQVQSGNLLLAGELFAANDHWLLTRLPRDIWELHHHRLQAVPANQANCLGEVASQLLAGRKPGQLHYWKLWQADAKQQGAPLCRIALLTAIEETGA